MKKSEKVTARFITLEGGEGVGKSSNIQFIQSYLLERGIDVLVTREPGGTPLAEEIRELFVREREEKVAGNTELLLVFAARAQHIETVIKPALDKGQWVLSDRFTDATYAYQGGGRGLSKQVIATLETLVQGELKVDLTFLLDLPADVGLSRARSRNSLDRIEQEANAFFEKVRNSYLERAAAEPDRFRIIDAGSDLNKVQDEIRQALDMFFLCSN